MRELNLPTVVALALMQLRSDTPTVRHRFSKMRTLRLLGALGLCAILPEIGRAATIEYFDHATYLSTAAPDTLISFDSLARGNDVLTGDEFSPQGLLITQRSGHPINVVNSVDVAAGSGETGTGSINSTPNAISSSFYVSGYHDNRNDDYDFEFLGGATTAGLWIGNVGPGSTYVEFLRSDGSAIASETFDTSHVGIIGNPTADYRVFYGITTDEAIAGIRTSEVPLDSDGIVFDDVQFSIVPESTTALLLASGLVGLAAARRRVHPGIKDPEVPK